MSYRTRVTFGAIRACKFYDIARRLLADCRSVDGGHVAVTKSPPAASISRFFDLLLLEKLDGFTIRISQIVHAKPSLLRILERFKILNIHVVRCWLRFCIFLLPHLHFLLIFLFLDFLPVLRRIRGSYMSQFSE